MGTAGRLRWLTTASPRPTGVVVPSEGWAAPKGRTPDGRVLASRGRRVAAFFIDLAIWLVPQSVILVAVVFTLINYSDPEKTSSGADVAVIVVLYLLLFALGILRLAVEAEKVARRGQTWGMQAMRLRVVDARNGGSISRGRAWGRAAMGTYVSGQMFGFGYWWAFFDKRHRALHDLVCNAVVIDES